MVDVIKVGCLLRRYAVHPMEDAWIALLWRLNGEIMWKTSHSHSGGDDPSSSTASPVTTYHACCKSHTRQEKAWMQAGSERK